MDERPLARVQGAASLLRFAAPSMGMMLFMGLYTIVDTFFVAHFVDTNALSAINIVCPVINLIVGLGTMLAAGGSAIVARKLGQGDTEEARRDFTLIVLAGVCTGLAVTVLGLLFLEEIIWGLGASPVLFPACRDYLTIQLFFALGNVMQVLYQTFFVTAGRPGLGLALAFLAGITNLALDYVCIVWLHLGIRGAALGTGIGYMLPALFGTRFFFTDRSALHFCRPKMDGRVLWESCTNGVSEMVSQGAAAFTTFLFNAAMMRRLGEDGVAAITVMIYAQFLLTALSLGFSMGVAPVISYHYGGGQIEQLRKLTGICVRCILAASVLVFLLSFFAGETIARLFAGENAAVFAITREGFSIVSFGFLFSGCNIFASAFLTALSKGKASAALSFLRSFGFLTLFLMILPEVLQVRGVWLSMPLAELSTLALAFPIVRRAVKP